MPGLGYVEAGNDENKFTYNGKELEDEFGLNWYHYGVRFYDPSLSRWHSIDPLDVEHGPYNYSYNSPIMFTDPDGAAPLDWIKNLATGIYEYRPEVTSADNTPDGFEYIGTSIDDVRANHLGSLSLFNPAKYFPSLSNLTNSVAPIDFSNYRGEIKNTTPVTSLGAFKNYVDKSPAVVRIPASAVFNSVDAIYISLLQGTGQNRVSLTGEIVSGSAITDNGVQALTTILSSPFLSQISKLAGIKGLNASQFSQKFKGTSVARSQPALRGLLNRGYNFGLTRQIEYTMGAGTAAVDASANNN